MRTVLLACVIPLPPPPARRQWWPISDAFIYSKPKGIFVHLLCVDCTILCCKRAPIYIPKMKGFQINGYFTSTLPLHNCIYIVLAQETKS